MYLLLFVLPVIFVGIWMSDRSGSYFGKLLWQLNIMVGDLPSLSYSLFYMFFLLFTLNVKIFKLSNKIFFSIIILAVIASIVWFLEITFRGWRGLYWLEYFHIAVVVIGLLFLYWLVYINKINNNGKLKNDVMFYVITYTVFLVIFAILLKLTFSHVRGKYGLFYDVSKYWLHYAVYIILQICLIFAANIVITKYEKVKIDIKLICLNLFSMIIIPIFTFLASFVSLCDRIIYISNIFDYIRLILYELIYKIFHIEFNHNAAVYADFLDPIDWIKMGSIIFGFVIYECLYIAFRNFSLY